VSRFRSEDEGEINNQPERVAEGEMVFVRFAGRSGSGKLSFLQGAAFSSDLLCLPAAFFWPLGSDGLSIPACFSARLSDPSFPTACTTRETFG
jgi:hypothetical protein